MQRLLAKHLVAQGKPDGTVRCWYSSSK